MKKISILKKILLLVCAIPLIFFIYLLFQSPSLVRNWTEDQKILATIDIQGDSVSIKDIRDFEYTDVDDYKKSYKDGEYKVSDVETLYYIIEPFGSFDGPAHTMFSFGFSDGRYLVISAEIRKELGESFGPIKGLFRSYEMSYVIGTENDLVKLRANHREDDMFVYPIRAEKEDIETLFVSMLKRAKELSEKPEFYNTLTNNCTTTILSHVNEIRNEDIPWSFEALMPSHSDKVIYNLGLIDTNLSLEEARKYYQVNALSREFETSDNYSKKIRKKRK